ncbi:TPA: FkbM family methyltransferase [Legionella pneumophila]|nr:FkbM family methyltransferase [Legionella pneumophila]
MLNLKLYGKIKNRLAMKNSSQHYLTLINSSNSLSLHERILLKQSLVDTVPMDYPNKEILMVADTIPQWGRLQSCKKEPETVKWLEETIQPGDVFYDIGANIGAYSLVASAITQSESITYAFEPGFSTFSTLSQNIYLNKSSNCIIPFQIALSDATTLVPFHYSNILSGAAMHGLEHPVAEEGQPFEPIYSQTIMSYRLDDFIEQFLIKEPNLIKIDVDGSELRVLKGAEKTLTKPSLRSILIELNEEHTIYKPIIDICKKSGFKLRDKYQRGNSQYYNYIYNR